MKLLNSLYYIINKEKSTEENVFNINLNPDCFIYKAHFPEQPITPGVCVTQIAVELAEEIQGCRLVMKHVKNVKFLSVMTPEPKTYITYILKIKDVDATTVQIQATATSREKVYAKMSIQCLIHDGGI